MPKRALDIRFNRNPLSSVGDEEHIRLTHSAFIYALGENNAQHSFLDYVCLYSQLHAILRQLGCYLLLSAQTFHTLLVRTDKISIYPNGTKSSST